MSIQAFEYLAKQVIEKDDPTTIYELMEQYLSDTTIENSKEATEVLRETLKSMNNPSIAMLQLSLATYAQATTDSMFKFYKWLNVRLQKVLKKEWTLIEFYQDWDKNYDSIKNKMHSEDTYFMDKVALSSIIININDLKE